jgi:hypothetical protein
MIKLLDTEIEVKVRKDELSLVKGMTNDCEKLFHDTMEKETGR